MRLGPRIMTRCPPLTDQGHFYDQCVCLFPIFPHFPAISDSHHHINIPCLAKFLLLIFPPSQVFLIFSSSLVYIYIINNCNKSVFHLIHVHWITIICTHLVHAKGIHDWGRSWRWNHWSENRGKSLTSRVMEMGNIAGQSIMHSQLTGLHKDHIFHISSAQIVMFLLYFTRILWQLCTGTSEILGGSCWRW